MTPKVEAMKPCLTALRAERALPSVVRGPVERAALARLAASCLCRRVADWAATWISVADRVNGSGVYPAKWMEMTSQKW